MESGAKKDVEINDLICPITLQIFCDPVVAADGRTYERAAIVQWIREHGTSPFTRQPLNINELQADDYLRKLVAERRNSTVSCNYYTKFDHAGLRRQSSTISYNHNINLNHPSFQRQISTISYNYNINVDQAVLPGIQAMANNNMALRDNAENDSVSSDNFVSSRCCLIVTYLLVTLLIVSAVIQSMDFSRKNLDYSETPWVTTSTYPSIVTSTYSAILTTDSPTYCRTSCSTFQYYYYDAIQVNVFTTGTYNFTSSSSIDTVGYIYQHNFVPSNPERNLLSSNDDGGDRQQFKLSIFLRSGITNILVITTFKSDVMGRISIMASGPASVTFTQTTTIRTTSPSPPVTSDNDICESAKWNRNGITVAGGNGDESALNQLRYPEGLFVDDNGAIYIADSWNNRVVKWMPGASSGRVLIQGNKTRYENHRQYIMTKVVVDKNGTMFICDSGNRQVQQWFKDDDRGETIIENISCYGLALDNKRLLYVSDDEHHRVTKWPGNKIVAGGNGRGAALNQFNGPNHMFVDQEQSLFVADYWNHRVMKWSIGAKEGIVVAGDNRWGESVRQLDGPTSVIIDKMGTLYVAEAQNFRITRWFKGSKSSTIIMGGPGSSSFGSGSTQLRHPSDLAFDRQGNLYVADRSNNRIQMFTIDKRSCGKVSV